MGPLTKDQKKLVFRILNDTASRLASDIANHKPVVMFNLDPVKLISELNEIIEVIGPDGEDLVPRVDPSIKRFSSKT